MKKPNKFIENGNNAADIYKPIAGKQPPAALENIEKLASIDEWFAQFPDEDASAEETDDSVEAV
jgi:hypothetical protein